MNGCNSHAARALATLAGLTLAAAGATAESAAPATLGEGAAPVLSPTYSPELNQRMAELGISDLSAPVSIAEFFPGVLSTDNTFTQLNPNNDTPNIASDPSVINAADINDFLGIDCIPDILSTIAPIGANQAYDNYGEPWTPAEGFLAGSEDTNPAGIVTVPGDMLIADSARFTIFGPANRTDDASTPDVFESDILQDPDFLRNSKWTFRYYRESGDSENLNSPHLPSIDQAARISGDNSQDLIAKFQYIGPGWFEETCVGFDSDAVPVLGIGVGISSTCLNFTGLGPSCIGTVGIDHDPVMMDHGQCYWVEWIPELRQTVDVASFWHLSGSSSASVLQDAQSWRDVGDPLTGFVNGTQGGVDYALCIDINLDPNNTGPTPVPAIDPITGEFVSSVDAGQNLFDYVASGCTSVVCNEPFGTQDTCPEAVPVANLTAGAVFGTSISGNTFCADTNGFNNVPDPAATPTGDTVGAVGLVQPLWYTVQGNGNDFAIDLCFPGTDDDNSVARSWWIAVYCSTPDGSCEIGEIFPVASANAFDNLNTACPLQYNPDNTGDFPRVEWPTTNGTTYSFAIFSELGDGLIEFQVEDLGTLGTAPQFQCSQCDSSVTPGFPTFGISDIDPLSGAVTSVGSADIIEQEDELSPNSPDGGVCNDGFGLTDALVDWRQKSRLNDFCSGLLDLSQNFPTQYDAWQPAFTPLNGAPQSDIFLPNFDGAALGGAPGGASSYDLTAALVPLTLPFAATLEGRLTTEPFVGNSTDYNDEDHFGFTVAEPALVRWTVTAETDFNNTINEAEGKIDPMTGMRDFLLGFDCDGIDSASDGGGGTQCATSLNSTVVFPGKFYYLSVTTDRNRVVDCLSTVGRIWWGDVSIFACPQIDNSGATQSQSDRCRTNFFEYNMGAPVFEQDMGSNTVNMWPNGDTRFSNLIDPFNEEIPAGLNMIQATDAVFGQPEVDADGEPVLIPDPMGANVFLATADFQQRDTTTGDLLFDGMTGAPLLENRSYFERTEFIQVEFVDTNRGCAADVETDMEDIGFDVVNLSTGSLFDAMNPAENAISGSIGEDDFSANNPFDQDWYELTPAGSSFLIEAEYFSDLFFQVYEAPTLIIAEPDFFSECPDMGGMGMPTEIPIGCEPLTLVGAGVIGAVSDGMGGCDPLADDIDGGNQLLISGLNPGSTYVVQVQLGEFLLGGVGNAGSGLFCEDDASVDGIAAYLINFVGENSGICVPDVTTTGATLPGQPGFGMPDGNVDLDDLGYFLGFFLNNDPSVADVTTSGATLQGQPGFGIPDGVVDLDDLGFFLNAWLVGCP
ncbi:MAG: GC-type dockerin domain-anchored protein [Planctomycetota bacterium]